MSALAKVSGSSLSEAILARLPGYWIRSQSEAAVTKLCSVLQRHTHTILGNGFQCYNAEGESAPVSRDLTSIRVGIS